MTATTSSFESLLYAVDDGVATITLNRPDKLNAFTAQMRDELIAAFDLTDTDDAVRAVVVTGAVVWPATVLLPSPWKSMFQKTRPVSAASAVLSAATGRMVKVLEDGRLPSLAWTSSV